MTFKRFMAAIATSAIVPKPMRWRILRVLGISQPGVAYEAGVRFRNTNVKVGRGSYFNNGVTFEGDGRVVVGERVAIGPETMLITSYHEVGAPTWRAGNGVSGYSPITVGDGVWIGARVLILPGVTIGAGCIIAAGAVVTKDTPPNTLWAGVPATQKRDLPTA